MTACREWNFEAANYLLFRGANASAKNEENTCLHLLAGHTASNVDYSKLGKELTIRLVDSGFFVDARNKQGRTAFNIALLSGNFEIATTLLSVGAEFQNRDIFEKGFVDYFDFGSNSHPCRKDFSDDSVILFLANLVASGAPLNMLNSKCQTLLHVLGGQPLDKRTLNILSWILENGGDPSLSDSEGKKPLHSLLSNSHPWPSNMQNTQFMDILAHLVRGCGDINSIVQPLGTPLHFFIRFIKENTSLDTALRALHILLDSGAEKYKINAAGETPVTFAMRLLANTQGMMLRDTYLGIIDRLIFPGMDFTDDDCNTICQLLSNNLNDRATIVHLLSKAKIKEQQATVVLGKLTNARAMESLLLAGFTPNSQDSKGDTPLHYQVVSIVSCLSPNSTGDPGILRTRILLENGANPNIQNNRGDTVLHTTCRNEISKSISGWSTFRREEYFLLLRLLRDHGAKVDIKNKEGLYPLDYLSMPNIMEQDLQEIAIERPGPSDLQVNEFRHDQDRESQRGIAPRAVSNRSIRNRCKVYEWRNNDWFDRGTGFCSVTILSVRLPFLAFGSICTFKFYELDYQISFVL
jgi:ankyrin repeat protein